MRLQLPKWAGLPVLIILVTLGATWVWTSVGPTGELRPDSRMEVTFPIFMSGAFDTVGYTWARAGDTIVVDYAVTLESGYFSLSVGKKRWFRRWLLADEQSLSLRRSITGQMLYDVRRTGLHAIWAGRYSVWRGNARVSWSVRRSAQSRAGHAVASTRVM